MTSAIDPCDNQLEYNFGIGDGIISAPEINLIGPSDVIEYNDAKSDCQKMTEVNFKLINLYNTQ